MPSVTKTCHPSNLEAFSLSEIERFEAIKQCLDDVRQKHTDEYIIVVLDDY